MDWIIALDDPDPRSAGFQQRRSITLTHIIDRAIEAQRTDRERWP